MRFVAISVSVAVGVLSSKEHQLCCHLVLGEWGRRAEEQTEEQAQVWPPVPPT